MQALIDNGIAIIIAIQSMGSWLLLPMRFFSDLGTEQFFFIVLPLIYWCVDTSLGIRIAFIVATNSFINYTTKILFAGPRPYWASSHVQALSAEETFGMPSGHAQIAVGVWGTLALSFKQKWVKLIFIFIILMIGFSRLYLGVHFLHDVLAGWLLGIIILWAFQKYWNPIAGWLAQKTFSQQTVLISVVTFLMIAIGSAVVAFRSDFQIPTQWIDNALLSGSEIAPVDPNGIFTSAGSFFGLALGVAWINAQGGYQVEGPLGKRALRYVIGLLGVLILWMGLGMIFPREADLISYALRFVRYSLVGWWLTGGAPWLFKHFNLTTSTTHPSSV